MKVKGVNEFSGPLGNPSCPPVENTDIQSIMVTTYKIKNIFVYYIIRPKSRVPSSFERHQY